MNLRFRRSRRPIDPSFHHISHRHLLHTAAVGEVEPADVDAIIVPTAWPVDALAEAMALAHGLDCVLVAVCSRDVSAFEAADLGDQMGVPVIAVDVYRHLDRLPTFSLAEKLAGSPFARTSDTAVKRNLALLFGRVAGWTRVLFLDDDIYGVNPDHARAAVGLLGKSAAVGLNNTGYPDNSVVCHAYRQLGPGGEPAEDDQQQFIGAGALAVSPMSNRSFFPDIYNQDWMFLLGHRHLEPPRVAVAGSMQQCFYDPFADPDRARREELGECLAEGLYWLLDHGLTLADADADHWRDFLERRQRFINVLLRRLPRAKVDEGARSKMTESLHRARETARYITADLLCECVDDWRSDLVTWQNFLDGQPIDLGLDKTLEHLGSSGVALSSALLALVTESVEG